MLNSFVFHPFDDVASRLQFARVLVPYSDGRVRVRVRDAGAVYLRRRAPASEPGAWPGMT